MIDRKEKMLLPWETNTYYTKRHYLFDKNNFLYIIKAHNSEDYCSYIFGKLCWGRTLEEAKINVDKYLIELGYILIPENKIEQYKTLL